MKLNADMSQRACVHRRDAQWVASPMPGVERIMLDRDGDEVARATSIVRYAPKSMFPAHTHGLGEEFLVLEGTFSDEHGDYPPGFYVRNPPGSQHTPRSDGGCILFVKLRQFATDDLEHVVVDTGHAAWQPAEDAGVEQVALHRHGPERVMLLRLAPGTQAPARTHAGGEEVLVLDGEVEDEHGRYRRHDWVRNPPGSEQRVWTDVGCTFYLKTGHLA